MLAPPWIPVPPAGYGGIEAVVALLCDELVLRGHEVTLFAAPGSRSTAKVHTLLEHPQPDTIGSALHECDHVARAWDEVERAAERGRPFDVIHDHSGYTALAMASRVSVPVVHTVHGPLTPETTRFYARHGCNASLVAISRSQFAGAPKGLRAAAIVPNPLAVEDWPLRTDKDDYLLWMGRMDPIKGAHRAIAVARRGDHRLLLAGPVQTGQHEYFRREIEPHLGSGQIAYVGEVAGALRKELFAGAKAFLMPIRWAEPFGMVMVEALACGTPVLAFPEGAASEIVIHGENGFHAADEQAMSEAIERLPTITGARCRASVAERYDVTIVARGYEAAYESAIDATRRRPADLDLRRQATRHWGAVPAAAPPIAEPAAGLQRVGRVAAPA